LYGCTTSSTVYIVRSVPQGSFLGPRLFILYTTDLADVTKNHGVTLHAFADDTQLYLHCRHDDMASTALQLERLLSDVGHWMSANRLKLNADKTKLLWAGSRHCCLTLGNRGPKLELGDDTIVPTNDVKVLGVTLSSDLTMDKHISNVCSAGFYRLRQLRRVRMSLDTESAATLVHAFITSRMDYCNVLLAGAPKATTDKLYSVF